MKKSAISGMFWFFAIFIVALIFLVVATLVIKQGSDNQIENLKNIQCRESNRNLANLVLTNEETGANVGISFVTQEVNENCPTIFTSVTSSKSEDMNEALASGLANCWDSYLEGKEVIFPKDTGGKSLCAICEVIDFSKIPNRPNTLNDFGSYLELHKSNIDKTKTYAQYLEIKDTKAFTSQPIYDKTAIVFYSTQDKKTFEDMLKATGIITGGTGTLIVTGVIIFSGPVGWALAGTAAILGGTAIFSSAKQFDNIIKDFQFQTGCAILDYEDSESMSALCKHIISANPKEPLI